MTRSTCRYLAVLMVACAVAVGWLSLDYVDHRREAEMTRLRDVAAEQDADLERQRRVLELVTIIECRRRGGCGALPAARRHECTKRVAVNGILRNQACGTS